MFFNLWECLHFSRGSRFASFFFLKWILVYLRSLFPLFFNLRRLDSAPVTPVGWRHIPFFPVRFVIILIANLLSRTVFLSVFSLFSSSLFVVFPKVLLRHELLPPTPPKDGAPFPSTRLAPTSFLVLFDSFPFSPSLLLFSRLGHITSTLPFPSSSFLKPCVFPSHIPDYPGPSAVIFCVWSPPWFSQNPLPLEVPQKVQTEDIWYRWSFCVELPLLSSFLLISLLHS